MFALTSNIGTFTSNIFLCNYIIFKFKEKAGDLIANSFWGIGSWVFDHTLKYRL